MAIRDTKIDLSKSDADKLDQIFGAAALPSDSDEIPTDKDTPETVQCINTPEPAVVEPRPEKPEKSQIRPWVRFFARYIDLGISTAIIFVILLGLAVLYEPLQIALANLNPLTDIIITTFVSITFWILVLEPVFISRFGGTPGKMLLKVSVRGAGGALLTYNQALSRSIHVWSRGYACGIVGLNIITLLIASSDLEKKGRTWWDARGNIAVRHEIIGAARGTLAVVIIGAIWVIQRLLMMI
jgi:uncharacterized RDD family membrane protein YckC